MSPEQIAEQKYNHKSDIWSAGCVLYEIISLRAPFEATNQIQLATKIKSGHIDRIP
jgi:NIMA (never in mitosis gene a)-related kinase 2